MGEENGWENSNLGISRRFVFDKKIYGWGHGQVQKFQLSRKQM